MPGEGDGDVDGFSADIDCDDTNPAINPGQTEVYSNGLDDDCNPDTPDKGSFNFLAHFITAPSIGSPGEPLQFQEQSRGARGGGIVSWEWDFENDGVIDSTGQNPLHTYATPGIFHVQLRLTDNLGNVATLLKTVSVADPQAAQGDGPFDHKETEFIIPLESHAIRTPLELLLVSETTTEVTVEYPMNSPELATTATVQPGAVTVVDLTNVVVSASRDDFRENWAVRVSATDEVTCYLAQRQRFVSSSALALPVNELGREYILAQQPKGGQNKGFAYIMAAFDSTAVTLEAPFSVTISDSSAASGSKTVDPPFTMTLDRGDVVRLQSSAEFPLTGVVIRVDQPISVDEQNLLVFPEGICCADDAYEVAPPVTAWGNEVPVANLPDRPDGSLYVIVAAEDGTTVTQDGSILGTIDRGRFIETPELPGNHVFAADKPIFVTQLMTGAGVVPSLSGDPELINMEPTEQYRPTYTFATVGGSQFSAHFATIIAENSDIACGTIYLDGQSLAASAFTPVGTSNFSAAIVPLSLGVHTTSSNGVHSVTVGGTFSADSYGHPAGPGGPAVLTIHNVDHFKCYTVKVNAKVREDDPTVGCKTDANCTTAGFLGPCNLGFPEDLQVSVNDQFTEGPKLFDLKKPTRLCTSVDKNDEGIKNPLDHLMCYQAKAVAKVCAENAPVNPGAECKREEDCGGTRRETSFCQQQPKHEKVVGIHVNNQFGPEQLDTIKEEEICVPSTMVLP